MFKEFFFKKEIAQIETERARLVREESRRTITTNQEVNRRVAEALTKMDPFEPLMRTFNGVFSSENERVEDSLDVKGQLMIRQWAWQNVDTPAFKYMTEWVMNVQANETLKRAPVTTDRILYGRAQISCMLLFVKEVKRLSESYKDMLEKGKKDDDFDPSVTVDE